MEKKPLLMLVEDSKLYLHYLKNLCAGNDFDFIVAENGIQAVEMLFTSRPDLILLDILLPGMNGYEVCKHIRRTPSVNQTPVIFLTGNDGEEAIVRGFEVGGNDYVTKPFNEVVLLSRINNQLEQIFNKQLLNDYIYELELINKALQEQKEHSEYLASRDHLTGTYNRRHLQSMIIENIQTHNQGDLSFSLALFDIDDFKHINDTYGHPCGDHVLVTFVEIIQAQLREEDLLARWGGEEFLLYAPFTTIDQAKALVNTILEAVENHSFNECETPFKVTATCGLSTYCQGEDYHQIFNRIDEALYEGKHNGKNQLVIQ